MELLDVMLRRRSVRRYTGEPIPEEKLDRIIKAGLAAPTSRGFRPCDFYVVKNKAVLAELAKAKAAGAGLLAGADAAIAVFADPERADTWIEDSSIALAFMHLMATEQGVGSCWVQLHMRKGADGSDAEDNARRIIGAPEGARIVGILGLGMPGEVKEPNAEDGLDFDKVHFL